MRLQQRRVLKLRKFNYLGENIKGLHLFCNFQSEKGKTIQQQQNPHTNKNHKGTSTKCWIPHLSSGCLFHHHICFVLFCHLSLSKYMQDLSTVHYLISFVLICYASSICLKVFSPSAGALSDLWLCGGFTEQLLIKSKLSTRT